MKLYNLGLLLSTVGKLIGMALMLVVASVFVVVLFGLFLLMLVGMFFAWLVGVPIKVTTPGMFPGTKYTRHYRWFTVVKN